ncbi:Dbl homology domain-containing protein [Hesseltinella vesiculosa]|uniref:Dbl homology domain-containing protein n=1 Tax=Hesseltinella vesiculosa TaxID=101127 RepID=A0A1X2GK33_9FUNG|nr:Dbl homology domain-containing protein [Hesseltinella vesiculosa]
MSMARRNVSISSSLSSSSQRRFKEPAPEDILHFLSVPLPPLPHESKKSLSSEDSLDMVHQFAYDDIDSNLIGQEMEYRQRESIVQQLLTTEKAYAHSLSLLDSHFLKPLKNDTKKSSFHFLGNKKMVCTDREFKWLFNNVETLVQQHRAILASLEERLQIWGPTQIISDVLHAWIPKLDMYYEYIRHYDVAMTTFDRLTKYQPFAKFIQQAQKTPTLKNETLVSLLQIPLQCIPRYESLFSALADHTTALHPDYRPLHHVKREMDALAKKMHSRLVDAENVSQVQKLQQHILHSPFGPNARRRLILQKELDRVIVNGKVQSDLQAAILFSDLLVFVRPKLDGPGLLYKSHVPLEHAKIRSLSKDEAGGDHALELISSLRGVDSLNSTIMATSTTHILFTGSEIDQNTWYHKFEKVIRKLDQIEAMASG